jgi:murein DD-endopeptidase MepM/ murein hydrolase activator NlpD
LGAFGAAGALLIGSCSPTTCAPVPAAVKAPTTMATARGVVALDAKPLRGPCTYTDTWGESRSAGRSHLGTDIGAAEGSEIYAVAGGEVIKVYTDEPGSLAGNGLRMRKPDGTVIFYAHLSALAPGIVVGAALTAGQLVGYVGHTGNAGGPHLHLEIHPFGGDAVNPYPIISAIGAC